MHTPHEIILAHLRFSCFTTKPTIPFFTGGRSRLGRILYNKTKCQPYHDHGNGAFFLSLSFGSAGYVYMYRISFLHVMVPNRLCMLRIALRSVYIPCV